MKMIFLASAMTLMGIASTGHADSNSLCYKAFSKAVEENDSSDAYGDVAPGKQFDDAFFAAQLCIFEARSLGLDKKVDLPSAERALAQFKKERRPTVQFVNAANAVAINLISNGIEQVIGANESNR